MNFYKNLLPNSTLFKGFVVLLIILFTGISNRVLATHAAGSDLSYRWISGNIYEVTVNFYRDCQGVTAPNTITLNVRSASCNQNFNATLNRIAGTGQEITFPCNPTSTYCNGGTNPGVQQYTFRGDVTIPSACADWIFSYSLCCRSCAISTITNQANCNNTGTGNGLYVEAYLNNVLANENNSPTFTNIPLSFLCVNQTFTFNHGVVDLDGDSLVYSFIPPKRSATVDVGFLAGFSFSNWLTTSSGVTINSATGDITMTPTLIGQVAVCAVLVREYRNGVLIGSVIRDMQFWVKDCGGNILPTSSGVNGTTNYSTVICPGSTTCFTINSNDLNIGQQITMSSTLNIPGATFTIANQGGASPNFPVGTFCWTPTAADARDQPYTFTVMVLDNNCDYNAFQIYSYSIVVPLHIITFNSPTYNGFHISCNGGNNGSATANVSGGQTPINYLWSNGDTNQTATGLITGTYGVTITDVNGCTKDSLISLTEPPSLSVSIAPSTIICYGDSTATADAISTGGIAPYTYLWSDGQTNQTASSLSGGISYSVSITDANGCTTSETFTINQPPAISVSAVQTDISCNGLNNGALDLTVSGGNPAFTFVWNNGSTTEDISGLASGIYIVTVTDFSLCVVINSFTILDPAPIIITSIQVNTTCGNSNGSIDISVTGGTFPLNYLWSNGETTQDLTGISSGSYTVTITDANNCTETSTLNLSNTVLPILSESHNDVLCNGNISGSIDLSATSGATPYTYTWSNGSTTQDISSLTAGNYSVTVIDNNNCAATLTINISEPAVLVLSETHVNVLCNGNITGSIDLSVSGGTSPYTYIWSNGATTQDLSSLLEGNYSVTVIDNNNCAAILTINISAPAALVLSEAHINVLCNGDNSGSIDLSLAGGTTPYIYLWSNGATTQDISSLTAGIYSVTVFDNNNCQSTLTINISEPAALVLSETHVNVLCNGNNTGSIDLSVTGGTSPYTYAWSNGATTQHIGSLSAGNYSVTVTDINNCAATLTINISELPAISLGETHLDASCGTSNGSIDLTVSGGTSGYSYLWSNAITSEDLIGVSAGTYSVTVTDAINCTAVMNVNISNSAGPVLSETHVNILCYTNNSGSIDLSVSGGSSPYNYTWSNGATTQDIISLLAGNYSVTVTDNNNCAATLTINITEPSAIVLSETHVNVLCNGNNSGSIELSVSGGTSPYNYIWSNGSTTQDFNSLTAGNYSVTVIDNNNCAATLTINISEPDALVLSETHINVLCYGDNSGSIDLSLAGGTAPYIYAWSNGATSQDINLLSAGNYSVTVTDINNCESTLTMNITETAALVLSEIHVNVLCNGNNTGSINLSVSGGTTPYTYTWSNGATTQDISSLTEGNYSVTVIDNNNCAAILTINISASAALVLSEAHINVLCNGDNSGSIDLSFAGGTTPYTYLWSNGATTQDISSLTAGIYSVTVFDNNNCQSTLTINISEPAALVLSETHVNVLCNGNNTGSINLSVIGGTTAYTYLWSNGATTQDISSLTAGNYSVTVTDNNNCAATLTINISELSAITLSETHTDASCGTSNGSIDLTVSGGTSGYTYLWSNGITTEDLSGVSAGTYSVTVTDANNCTEIMNVNISNTAGPVLSETHVNVLCNGNNTGSIDLSVSGGTTPYTYTWSNGATSQDISLLTAGLYSVTITDDNNCQATLSINISEPPALVLNETHANVLCNGNNAGSIDLSVSGGTTPYTYTWSNGATTQDINLLIAGTYSITVTDNNNCQATLSINISEPAALVLSETHTDASCGTSNGSIDLTVSGGTSGYTYLWSNGITTEDLSGVSAGTYSVTVTDANNCTAIMNVNISNSAGPVLSETHVNVLCNGNNTGSIDLSVSGGTTPYTYTWSNGATTEDLTGLDPDVYNVTVIDANGCTATGTTNIIEPDMLMIMDTVINDVTCFGSLDGGIDITIMGGTAAFTYAWSNGATTEDLTNISGTLYYVTVTDVNNCQVIDSFNVNEPTQLTATISITDSIFCAGIDSASIDLTVSGGTTSYNFSWSNGGTTEDLTNVAAGNYTVTITDANGCTATANVDVTQPAVVVATATQSQSVNCNGNATGVAVVTATGGTAPYTYIWSTTSTNDTIAGLLAATYFVTVTDVHGCSDTTSVIITQPLVLDATIVSITDVNCTDLLSGAIDINVTGGTSTYNYNWSNSSTTEDLTGIGSGTYFVTVTDANGCTDTLSAIVDPAISVSVSITADDTISCNGANDGQLTAVVLSGGTGPFTFLWSNTETTQTITGLSAGTYTVTVTNTLGCTYVATYQLTDPAIPTFTGGGTTIACGTDGTLTATLPAGYNGTWTLVSGTGNIDDPSLPVTTVTGLGNTDNVFVWTITNGICTFTDTATLIVTDLNADAGPDQSICDSVNVQLSGSLSAGSGTWSSSDNGITFSNETDPSTTTSGLTVGQNTIIWTVTDGNCIEIDTVIITVKSPIECNTDSLQMPTGFSPNGDGPNDYFVIHGLIHYPVNNFSVFNRWGNKVYEKKNYNNEWDGTNNSGDKLPDGTYFVLFEAPNLAKPLSGYVDMRR